MLDPIAGKLEHYMDLLALRQKIVASNLANADTPGYLAKDIDFATELSRTMTGAEPTVVEVQGLSVKNDGNNVNVDREARMLAENGLRFQLASQLMRSELRAFRSAILEGREG
jgi:flagellar basal-body rod protein FlgB